MKTLSSLALAPVLALCLPLLSTTTQAAEPEAPVFSRHDINRDGYIDGREYYRLRQRVRARRGHAYRGDGLHEFDRIDTDADGRISRDEVLQRIDVGQD